MVDTDLPRPVGDLGNAGTFAFPVLYGVARGASPDDMVSVTQRDGVDEFLEAARELTSMGAEAISTSCGLMARHQQVLVEALDVPVASSSLLFAGLILRILPARSTLGVLTIDSEALEQGGHFDGVGLAAAERARVRIAGMEGTAHFHHAIMGGGPDLDPVRAADEVLSVAKQLIVDQPDVGALLLECTNLSPYANVLRRATGLPVWDAGALVRWLHEGLDAS